MAKRFQGYELVRVRDCDRGSREGALRNGFAQTGEGAGKDFVLVVKRRQKSWSEVGQVDAR
jgi:hypothetical protein